MVRREVWCFALTLLFCLSLRAAGQSASDAPQESRWNPARPRLFFTPEKMARLRQWCEDATAASQAEGGPAYRFVYVDQAGWERNPPRDLSGLRAAFREFQ